MKNSKIHVSRNPKWINDYFIFICSQLEIILANSNNSVTVRIQNFDNDSQQTINVYVNTEHVIINVPASVNLIDTVTYGAKTYGVILDNENEIINSYDYLFDYSNVNVNVLKNSTYKFNKNNILYVPPLYFQFDPSNTMREIQILTTFINPFGIVRRRKLIERLQYANLPHQNVSKCFGLENNKKLLDNTKIILNIRQNENRLTFEDCRCLPALLRGVVIISEDVPFKEYIPYNKFIIWTNYDNMTNTVTEVLNNYESYRAKIYDDPELKQIIDQMKETLTTSLTQCLQ